MSSADMRETTAVVSWRTPNGKGHMMETVTAQQVADYLNGLPRTQAAPVVVRIGKTKYVGALYTQERDTPEGCRAYREGQRIYYQRALYLVGDLPSSYLRSSHTAYVWSDDRMAEGARWYSARRWYVAGWYDLDAHSEYHPFGHMFQLMPDSDGTVTKDDDGFPYATRPMTLVCW